MLAKDRIYRGRNTGEHYSEVLMARTFVFALGQKGGHKVVNETPTEKLIESEGTGASSVLANCPTRR